MDDSGDGRRAVSYRPLATGEFRLLQILPKSTPHQIRAVLSHHQFPSDVATESRVKYTALSYCWGSSQSVGSVTLDGSSFSVTANLSKALGSIVQHHMPNRRTLFWIDAICIDQSNLEEKAEQVRQMWRIFQNAELVFAWLGDEERDVRVLHESRERYGDSADPSQDKTFSDINVALLNLSRRAYFTRTWTRPEFLRAKTLILISGKFKFDWDWVMRRIEAWPKRRKHEALPANAYQLFLSRGTEVHKERSSMSHVRLADMLRLYSRTGCYDARDRIFSMLSDPGWPKLRFATWWIQPDYRLSKEDLALLVLAYYDYLFKWDSRRRPSLPGGLSRDVCDSVMVALETSRVNVRSMVLEQARLQNKTRTDRLELGYGFDVEFVGPVLSTLWSGTGVWEERPA